MGLAMGETPIDGLCFASALAIPAIDFASDWVMNPDNSEGISIEPGKVIISKFKPKEWLLRSNYGFANANERNAFGLNARFKFGGLQALWGNAITYNEDHPIGDTGTTYRPIGLVISPIRPSDGLLLSHAYPWDMNIPGGCFKHVYGYAYATNWSAYGYGYDIVEQPYNFGPGWAAYSEIGFAVWTGTEGGEDGYIVLDNPITIEAINYYPLTIEGYKAALGATQIYSKAKTVENALMRWGLAARENNTFSVPIQGYSVPILKSGYQRRHEAETGIVEDPYAIVVRAGSADYARVVLPEISDIAERIAEGYPIKFACTEFDYGGDTFWKGVINALANTVITDAETGYCLFALSNIKGAFGDNESGAVEMTFQGENEYHDITRIFDHATDIDKVKIRVISGNMQTLLCAFRACKKLTSLEFSHDEDTYGRVNISQWSGAFENCSLENFPEGLGVVNREELNYYNEGVSDIHYGFDNSSLKRIGNYKDEEGQTEDEKFYRLVVDPLCLDAVYNAAVTEIRFLLDFKYVIPNSDAHRVLLSSSIKKAWIKNLNKGDWSLDDTTRNGCRAANFINLEADSVNYLLENIYDLTQNPTGAPNSYNQLSRWSVDTGTFNYRTFNLISFHGEGKPSIKCTPTESGTLRMIVQGTGVRNWKVTIGGVSNTYQADYSGASLTLTLNLVVNQETIISADDSLDSYDATFQIDPSDVAQADRSTVTSANLYCPSNWSDKIDAAKAQIAQSRGWSIYIAGTLVVY